MNSYPENCREIVQDADSKGILVIPNGEGTFDIFDMFIPSNKAEKVSADDLYDAVHMAIVTSDRIWNIK